MSETRLHQDLNGPWRLVLDPENIGKERHWYQEMPSADVLDVRVPAVWDLWVPDYDGAGWYFREFEIGRDWAESVVFLNFEAVDYFAEVWLNGTRLGEHEGGYTPFSLNCSGAIRMGEPNRLAVRVVDPHGQGGFGTFRTEEIPCAKEKGYFSFAGIWGGVSLEGKPVAHLRDVFAQPDPRRNRVVVQVERSQPGPVRLSIEGTDCQIVDEADRLVVDFPDFSPWSPDSPTLYNLRCDLLEGDDVVDTQTVRFGMREFTVKDNRFHLNGRPFFVQGVLHQPDYARSLAAPESEELARTELERAKEAGFNLIRLHIKTAPTITLDLADEIGLLVYAEPPIGWIKDSPWMRERCEREVREMILRDRNHPSVVIWGMLNESGNAGYVINGGAQTIKSDLCALARSLDPTRLIIDDSGGVNATREPARYMRPYRDELKAYDDLHIYQRAPVDWEIENYFRHSGDPDALVFLSEFGFGGMEDLGDVLAQYGADAETLKDARFVRELLDAAQEGFRERGLDRLFGDFAGFTKAARELQCDAARYQIDAMRTNPKLAGYCYTQLCDAGHEFCAGVLDRWRRPKEVFDAFRRIQARLRPVIQAAHTNLVPRQEVAVSITLINEDRLEDRVDLSLQVVGPTNQVLWKKKRGLKLPRSGKEIWSGTIAASGAPGAHKFVVRLMRGMTLLAENALEFHVFPQVDRCDIQIRLVDPENHWRKKCLALALERTAQVPVHIIPPLANTVRAYPEADLARVLSEVHGGAVALVFSPPDDWNDFADQVDPALRATSKDAVGAFLGMYHYAKLHPIFEGLPARGLMRQPYRNTVPPKTFIEPSDEDICGTFDTTPLATGNYMIAGGALWANDILVRRYGSGRIVFTHLRVLEHLGEDPVADRLFVNLLTHFSRRSLPSDDGSPLPQHAISWLQNERAENTRLWSVIGMFPNWGDAGHEEAYPPEDTRDFDATYPGWYKPIRWRRWYSLAREKHVVNLQDAFSPVYEYYPRFDNGTGYAYAEFYCDRRQSAFMHLGIQDAMKVWLNGRLVFEDSRHLPHLTLDMTKTQVTLRQGRNNVLVKISKMPGEFRFSFDLTSATRDPLRLAWWH